MSRKEPLIRLRKAPSKSSRMPAAGSPEPNLHVRLILKVYCVHKTHPRRRKRHDDGLRSGAVAKKAHAFQQIAISDAAGGKDNLSDGRTFLRVEYLHVISNHTS